MWSTLREPTIFSKEVSHARQDLVCPVEAAPVERGHDHDDGARGRSEVEAEVRPRRVAGRSPVMRLRRIAYSLGWMAAMAIAIGAGWKPK